MKNFVTILKNDVPALMCRAGLIDRPDPALALRAGASRALVVQAAVLAGYVTRTAQRRIRDLVDQGILRVRPDGRLICVLWAPAGASEIWLAGMAAGDDAEA